MKVSSKGKDEILAQIREALGRQERQNVNPESLRPFRARTLELKEEERVELFVCELEKVGADAVRPRSTDGVMERLNDILDANPEGPIAVSDGEALRRLGLRKRLEAKGRRVVPTLREFIAEAMQSNSEPDATHTHIRVEETSQEGRERVTALMQEYRKLLLEAAIGITTADYALADTGSLVIVSGEEQHRLISLLPPAHICFLDPARILPSLSQLLERMSDRFSSTAGGPKSITCITGPSRTADIEQEITMGVHGPKSLRVFLYPE